MDKRKSLINVSVSIFFRLLLLISVILVRRFLIIYIGNEVNGLDSLYTSLIGFISVAELGVGSAITFCMYKPIVENDNAKVAALYQLFTKSYRIIGLLMLIIGCCLIPFLPYLAKDYSELNTNLGFTFLLMLVSVVISYVFSAKTSLINAYKNNYVTTTISSCGMIFQQVLQIISIVITRSFAVYLSCRIIAMLLQWVVTEIYTYKNHKDILKHSKETISGETKKEIINKIKALFMHKLGANLVTSTDSMIISAFIGVVMLGKYSNYTAIAIAMTSVIALAFTPLTSIIGHTFVAEKEKTEEYFRNYYFLNFILGMVFFLGYYAVIDDLVLILFGDNLELSKTVSMVITVNYFVIFMRQATLLFRDATGTFYNDRWKPILEGALNVVLSIAFVKIFLAIGGGELGIVGVIVATIITNLLICHPIEPFVLYKYAFNKSVKKHLIKNYIYVAVFVFSIIVLNVLKQPINNAWLSLFINGAISLGISFIVVFACFLADKNLRKNYIFKRNNKEKAE